MADANKIDHRFLFPKIDLLLKYNNLTTSEKDQMQREKKVPIQANTIKNRISRFERFIDFLEARQIFAGIHSKCFSTLSARYAEFKKQLKDLKSTRDMEVREKKAENILTPEETINYRKSVHVQQLGRKLKALKSNKKQSISKRMAIDTRDFLMFMISIGNGLRSSNLLNLTIFDFNRAIEDPDFKRAKILQNKIYKTSIFYGTKFIVLEYDLHEMLTIYIIHLRPLFITDEMADDKKRYLFTSSRSGKHCTPMTQSNIAQALSSTFRKAKVVSIDRAAMISNCLPRATVVSYAFKCGMVEDLEGFANNFMKHRSKTLQKHDHVKHFAAHQTLKYSMNLYNIFGN